jgi:predicted anti-sigma-YlaC factor YlaD
MRHEKFKTLIIAYLDGEIRERERIEFLKHLEGCEECRREYEDFKKIKEVISSMKFTEPDERIWETYWSSIYNKLERKLGWIFTSIGAIILIFYGAYKAVENIIKDPSLPLFLKVGILSLLLGITILFVSVLRERLFIRKRERYKEVEK